MRRLLAMPLCCVLAACLTGAAHAQVTGGANRFLDAGVPAADREWFGPEYQQAAEVFAAGRVALPALSDEAGAALFARLTSLENLSACRNGSLPVWQRLQVYDGLQQGLVRIFKLYLARGAAGRAEQVRLLAFTLHVQALGLDLVDEALPTVPRDERYPARMDAVRRMRSGATTVVVGCEMILGDRDETSRDAMPVLIEAMESTLPTLKRAFTDAYRVELIGKLKARLTQYKGEDAKRILNMMVELLKR